MSDGQASTFPTIIHATHHKAGSQWIHQILKRCVPEERLVADAVNGCVKPGAVYAASYIDYEHLQQTIANANGEVRHFFVIRDLRDATVSGYFSVRFSHAPMSCDRFNYWRERTSELSFEDGMLLLIDEWTPILADIQRSWVAAEQPLIRYEDLLTQDAEILVRLLTEACPLGVDAEVVEQAVCDCRFEKLTDGRPRGVEDFMSHERKGIAGDWKNYFSPAITEGFKERFGQLLIDSGYEENDTWKA